MRIGRAASILPGLLLLAGASQARKLEHAYVMPEVALLADPAGSEPFHLFESKPWPSCAPTATLAVEGGWSALELDPSDPTGSTFWSINDLGMAVSHEAGGRNDRVVAFPGYHQKIVRFRVTDSDTMRIVEKDSIKVPLPRTGWTTGQVNNASPSDVVALAMDRATGRVDTSAKLPASPDGYDFEGLGRAGGTFWLADEQLPSLLEVDSGTLRIRRALTPGSGLPKVLARRRSNRGIEALATTPSGTVVAMLQSPLYNAQGTVENSSTKDSPVIRVLVLDPVSGLVREHVYLSDRRFDGVLEGRRGRDCKVGDMAAIDDHRVLVVEHGEDLAGRYWVDLWEVDFSRASDVSTTNKIGITFDGGTRTLEQLPDSASIVSQGIVPVAKRLVRSLGSNSAWESRQPEGLAIVDDTTVAMLSDDNYGCSTLDSSDGGSDGICHISGGWETRSRLMYLRVPSLGLPSSRASKPSRARRPVARAIPGGVEIEVPGSASLEADFLSPGGRRLLGPLVGHPGADGRVRFAVSSPGLFLVRIRQGSWEHVVAIPQVDPRTRRPPSGD